MRPQRKTCRWSPASHWPLIAFRWKDPRQAASQKHSSPTETCTEGSTHTNYREVMTASWLRADFRRSSTSSQKLHIKILFFCVVVAQIITLIAASSQLNTGSLSILSFQQQILRVMLLALMFMVFCGCMDGLKLNQSISIISVLLNQQETIFLDHIREHRLLYLASFVAQIHGKGKHES